MVTEKSPRDAFLELTLRGTFLGALITLVFTASNVYLGLKVGLTFSSSIPAAVISMAVLKVFSDSNILENNMVQTQASAAGTLSAVIFALPAILMVGYWQNFHFLQTMGVCMAGGFLGVLFSIPLRRVMVVNSDLPYPEGVAAAEILHAGHDLDKSAEGGAKDILFGGVLAAVISFLTTGLHVLTDKASFWASSGKAVFHLPLGFSLALVSAGYLMGFTAGLAMLIGAVLAWGGFVPYMTAQLGDTAGASLADLAMNMWSAKVRFIGAGALAVAAVWTLITLLKPMLEGIRLSFRAMKKGAGESGAPRTDLDLSMKNQILLMGAAFLILTGTFHSFISTAPLDPLLAWGLVAFAVVMVFIIGFFIASACGYMAGLIGSSNSPISGIGVIAVIIISTLLVFAGSKTQLLDSPGNQNFAMALAIFITTAVISVAAISNDNLQDLKTGLLVSATPRNQQIALIIGCAVGALVIAPTLELLYEAYGFAGAPLPRPGMDASGLLSAPQATLMKTIATGIFSHDLDWSMLGIGLVTGGIVILLDIALKLTRAPFRISALAVGLGIYLPPHITAAIIVGSLLNVAVKKHLGSKGRAMSENSRGVLVASGFIVGESLTGVVLAIAVLGSLYAGRGDAPFSLAGLMGNLVGGSFEAVRTTLSLLVFALICAVFYRRATA